jgi:hypothetical protein
MLVFFCHGNVLIYLAEKPEMVKGYKEGKITTDV